MVIWDQEEVSKLPVLVRQNELAELQAQIYVSSPDPKELVEISVHEKAQTRVQTPNLVPDSIWNL